MARREDEPARAAETVEDDGEPRVRRAPGRGPALRTAAGAPMATAGDAAQAAVDGKGAGSAPPAGVRSAVEAQVGTSLAGARVHTDDLAAGASAALGARAFAYGSDVFLGAGESAGDTALMAHELTHVAQQTDGVVAPQRRLEVGAAGSPAERQADQVADRVAGGAAPAALIVSDDLVELAPGQMRRSDFIDRLQPLVTAAADEELGAVWSALGCPYIEQYFRTYRTRSAEDCQRLVQRFAPNAASARSAEELMPALVDRVRQGVRAWRDTGALPPEAAGMAGPAGPGDDAAIQPAQAQLKSALGPGEPVDAPLASEAGAAYGDDFADVRVHRGAAADALTDAADAHALTVGSDVVVASGERGIGSPEGDALMAHELAHVTQQRGSSGGGLPALAPAGAAHEADADRAAAGVVQAKHAPEAEKRGLIDRIGPALRSGFSLQRCSRGQTQQTQQQPAGPAYEACLEGTTPWTEALAVEAMQAYTALSSGDRAAWFTRWSAKGQLGGMLRALPTSQTSTAGTYNEVIQDLLQRVQRGAATEHAATEGMADQAAMAQTQADFMVERNRRAAEAARGSGAPPPTDAEVAAQQADQVSQTSIAPQTATMSAADETRINGEAATAITTMVAHCTANHPNLGITAADFHADARGIFERGENIIAYAGFEGGRHVAVVGEEFVRMVNANPAYALPTVVHELRGHNEYGEYGEPGVEHGLELYDQAAALMPGYTQPTGDGRTSEIDAYAYQETEIYSLLREIEFYTPNAPEHAHITSNYDPEPAIQGRLELMKDQFEERVARSLVRGMVARFRMDPRLPPRAVQAFERAVAAVFPGQAALTQ